MSRFTPDEASRLPQEIVAAAAGWAGHVDRFKTELDMTVASDPASWGFHDYIATLLIRDQIEKLLCPGVLPAQQKIANFIQEYDKELISFTNDDEEELFMQFVRSGGGLGADEFMADRWWWHRVPQSGPVLEELLDWRRRIFG
ncbi:MAG: hypothetical protein JO242_25465 [Streptosporangiaceae bacterium]|nr:hypothetical protein [Streptosporangiaceae bacterium]